MCSRVPGRSLCSTSVNEALTWFQIWIFSILKVGVSFVSFFSVLVQKIFFAKLQVKPQKNWQFKAREIAKVDSFYLKRNGGKLAAMFLQPKSDKLIDKSLFDTVVIFSHPISRKAKYFCLDASRAQLYLARGCNVLAFDYNGFGESDRIDLFYWRDAVAAIEYVQNKFPQKKIILHGVSFGAFHIIRAISSLPENSRVILENVNKSLFSYWRRWPSTRYLVILLRLARVKAIQDMDVQSFFMGLQRRDLDMRFIACEEDDLTTLNEMEELYGLVMLEQKQFFVFSKARHLSAPTSNPELYLSALFGERQKC